MQVLVFLCNVFLYHDSNHVDVQRTKRRDVNLCEEYIGTQSILGLKA